MKESDIAAMGLDPYKSLLEENERALAAFVLKAMDQPESIAKGDIQGLRDCGWTDSDIFDALAQGVGMIDHSIFLRVIKPEFD